MAYTHATTMKRNLLDIEHMARRTNDRLSSADRVMPWESDLVSQANAQLRSVYRYRKYKDRFGYTHQPKTPFAVPASDYGGCGTFLGITKDPIKRACLLERKIARAQGKCDKGKKKHCDKVQRFQSELATITGQPMNPTQGSAVDFYYQQAIQAQQGVAGGQSDGIEKYIPVIAAGAVGIVLLYGANKLL